MLKPSLVCSALVLCVLSLPTLGEFLVPFSAAAQPMAQSLSPSWQALRGFWQRSTTVPRKRGAGRPDGSFEVISPGIWVDKEATTLLVDETLPVEVWNTQPMVIWQSNGNPAYLPNQLEVLQADQTVIWSQPIPSAKFVALSVGEVLQPGQRYQIRFLKRNMETKQDVSMMKPVEIQVMSNEQHNQITQQLNDAEAEARSRKATPPEIAEARIEVFVKKQLWSDALQELNSVNLPVAERQALTQEVVKQWNKHSEHSDAVGR